jgi:hypothetical protein
MGAAVVSATDLFRAADFRPVRRVPASALAFAGHFASLGQINDYLMRSRRRALQWRPSGDEYAEIDLHRSSSRSCLRRPPLFTSRAAPARRDGKRPRR